MRKIEAIMVIVPVKKLGRKKSDTPTVGECEPMGHGVYKIKYVDTDPLSSQFNTIVHEFIHGSFFLIRPRKLDNDKEHEIAMKIADYTSKLVEKELRIWEQKKCGHMTAEQGEA